MDMRLRYMLMALLIMVSVLGIRKLYSAFVIKKNGTEFILCTNSSGSVIDCGVFEVRNNKPVLLHALQVKNDDVVTFTNMICDVLEQIKHDYGITIEHACFSAPGVPSVNQDYLTHWRLPYVIDAQEIIQQSGLKTAVIINNFLALSYGIDAVDSTITTLYDVPAELHGRRAIIGAGDGLGSVMMVWDASKNSYMSLSAEAGTGNFPAFTQFEFDLAERMKQERNFDTCHWAFFVAVPGIEYTYKILKSMNLYQGERGDMDKPAGLTILDHANDDALCRETANLFFKYYGRFAYNFVWTALPFGGLYLVGETATDYPELLAEVFLPEFFNCVASKQEVVKRIPVYVIHAEDNMKLYGAAQYLVSEKM